MRELPAPRDAADAERVIAPHVRWEIREERIAVATTVRHEMDEALAATRVAEAHAQVEIEKQRTTQAVAQVNGQRDQTRWRVGVGGAAVVVCAFIALFSPRADISATIGTIATVLVAIFGMPEAIEAFKKFRRDKP